MTLPYSEEAPRKLTDEEKGKEVLKLVGVVFGIDAIAIVGYFILVVLVLERYDIVPMIPVVVVFFLTFVYFQWKLKKIKN